MFLHHSLFDVNLLGVIRSFCPSKMVGQVLNAANEFCETSKTTFYLIVKETKGTLVCFELVRQNLFSNDVVFSLSLMTKFGQFLRSRYAFYFIFPPNYVYYYRAVFRLEVICSSDRTLNLFFFR